LALKQHKGGVMMAAGQVRTIASGLTDAGRLRPHNEDAYYIENDKKVFSVADGIGGAAAGEVASSLFIKTVSEVFVACENNDQTQARDCVKHVFLTANIRVLDHVAGNPAHEGMGCTAELLTFYPGGFVLGHIGDSRAYRLRQGVLTQLTKDHSLVQQQIDEGLIDTEQAKHHPMRNVILRAVGVDSEVAVDILSGLTYSGDLYLLCTDGLHDMLDDVQIAEVLLSEKPLTEKASRLVYLANEAGGRDNISVVLIEVEE
jgi:PPM family protein phosphatase